jgi:hypothetical protein
LVENGRWLRGTEPKSGTNVHPVALVVNASAANTPCGASRIAALAAKCGDQHVRVQHDARILNWRLRGASGAQRGGVRRVSRKPRRRTDQPRDGAHRVRSKPLITTLPLCQKNRCSCLAFIHRARQVGHPTHWTRTRLARDGAPGGFILERSRVSDAQSCQLMASKPSRPTQPHPSIRARHSKLTRWAQCDQGDWYVSCID